MGSKRSLIYGVGVNDADYQTQKNQVVNGKQKLDWICPFYIRWKSMLQRCYDSKFQEKNPTYKGCSTINEWHKLSNFRSWMQRQDWEGNQLDKDLLIQGNKIYSPDTCIFIDKGLNAFTTDSGATRGKFPIGVSFNKMSCKFMSTCCNPFTGKQEFLGHFTCQNQAHEAWRVRKRQHAFNLALLQADERVAKALRERY